MHPTTLLTTTVLALPALATAFDAEDWTKFNDWSIADTLYPSLSLHGTGGFSTGDPADLATGAHDPQRESFSAQAIEPSLGLRTEYLQAFATGLFYQDGEGDWDGELEEAYAKLTNLPGGFELKGGQFLADFGALNATHLHAWDFIDSELANSRFLGHDGLQLQGAELLWNLPLNMEPGFSATASLSFGNATSHDHDHAGHDHADHDDDDDHDHEDEETPHDADNAFLNDNIVTARIAGNYHYSDFHSLTGGLSWTGGENGFGRDTHVVGADLTYLWRENGLEPGGRAFRWRNELLYRDVDAFSQHDEDDDGLIDETFRGSYHELGFHSHAIYSWNPHIDTALRIAWVEGVDDFGQNERVRVSPALTWWIDPDQRLSLRTQYNYDSIKGSDDEHTLWFQLNLTLGSHL